MCVQASYTRLRALLPSLQPSALFPLPYRKHHYSALKDLDLHIRQLMHTGERLSHLIYWFPFVHLSLSPACMQPEDGVVFPFVAQGE